MLNITPTTIIYFFLIILGISIILYMMGVFTPNAAPPVEKFGSNYTLANVKILFMIPPGASLSPQQQITYNGLSTQQVESLKKYNDVYQKFLILNSFKKVDWTNNNKNEFKIIYIIYNKQGQIEYEEYIYELFPEYERILSIINEKLTNLNSTP